MFIFCDKVSNIVDLSKDYKSTAYKKVLGKEIVERFSDKIEGDLELKNMYSQQNQKELQSWENSIPEILSVIADSGLEDLFVVFEYVLPVGMNRIDCTVIGRNKKDEVCILVVELKQWVNIYNDLENTNPCKVKLSINDIERYHPLAQIQTYSKYLESNHSFCVGDNVNIYKCAYLHNFEDKEQLFKKPYDIYRKSFYDLTFTKNDEEDLKKKLNEIFINKSDYTDVEAFCNGSYTTGESGLEELHNILNNKSVITLLEEQRDIISLFSNRLSTIKNDNERIVEVISGNVGSGKTYLAFEMLRRAIGKFGNSNCFYTLVNATVRDVIEGTFDSKIALYTDSVAKINENK